MNKAVFALLMLCLCFKEDVLAGPNWAAGNLSNITSGVEGLMIMIDTALPDNCVGTPYGWMLIKEANKP